MKIAFRNFLTMLRRYKASSLLNIVGLTLAFTAFYIILVQVRWELTYNRSIPDADRIYLVELQSWYEPGSWQSWINRPVSERVIASASGVAACGPKPMLKAIAAIAKQAGVPCQVSMEERMGCGIGACLVCACALKAKDGETRYGHVCKDGPVFNAEEVEW